MVLPVAGELTARVSDIAERIEAEGGKSYRFRLRDVDDAQDTRLRAEWNALREQEYAEIVEECETKFAKEVEFEIFRGNFTAGEAEEIEADLEKIRTWFARVSERDLFGAPKRRETEQAIAHSARLLDDFVDRVYRAEEVAGGPVLDAPLDLPWGEIDESSAVPDEVVPLDQKRPVPKRPASRRAAEPRKRRRDGSA